MTIISLEQAQAKLSELIATLAPGDEVVITKDNQPVAQLTPISAPFGKPVPGRCKGMLTIIEDQEHTGEAHVTANPQVPGTAKGKLVLHAEDEEHLRDFQDYMPE